MMGRGRDYDWVWRGMLLGAGIVVVLAVLVLTMGAPSDDGVDGGVHNNSITVSVGVANVEAQISTAGYFVLEMTSANGTAVFTDIPPAIYSVLIKQSTGRWRELEKVTVSANRDYTVVGIYT